MPIKFGDILIPEKRLLKIGDGVSTVFTIEHPSSPNVVTSLYSNETQQIVLLFPDVEKGAVVYTFAAPPKPGEFTAMVIG